MRLVVTLVERKALFCIRYRTVLQVEPKEHYCFSSSLLVLFKVLNIQCMYLFLSRYIFPAVMRGFYPPPHFFMQYQKSAHPPDLFQPPRVLESSNFDAKQEASKCSNWTLKTLI